MHTMIKISILLFFTTIVAGCKHDDNPIVPPLLTYNIMPLTIGNHWIRKTAVFDTSGTAIATVYDTVRVLRDTLIDNKKWYVVFNYDGEYILQNKSDGLWLFWSGGGALQYKYPANSGDSYRYFANTDPTRVLSTDSIITLSSVSFHCYVYYTFFMQPTVNGKMFEFYSPNVGFVYREYYQSFINPAKLYLYSRTQLVTYAVN